MQTHAVLLAKQDLLCTFFAELAVKKKEHNLEVALLEIWWLYLNWAMEIPADLKVYFAWPCRFIAACGGIETNVDECAVRAIGEDVVKSKKALCPLALEGHWTLLIVDMVEKKLKFVDTLHKIKALTVKKMEAVLKIFKTVDGLQWLPADIGSCRVNGCRQGADVSCGYYVCWFLEEELRRSLGECPFHRGYPDADAQIKRLVTVTQNLLPVEKKMQMALGSKLWKADKGEEKSAAAPAASSGDSISAAVADLSATLQKVQDPSDFPGVDMPFPLEQYDGDLECWARDVQTVLTEEHQGECRKVQLQHAVPGCSKCTSSCADCYWPKTVRYWRRVETKGRFADVEGYSRMMKAPATMEF